MTHWLLTVLAVMAFGVGIGLLQQAGWSHAAVLAVSALAITAIGLYAVKDIGKKRPQ